MKKKIIITLAILSCFILLGCGKETPKSVITKTAIATTDQVTTNKTNDQNVKNIITKDRNKIINKVTPESENNEHIKKIKIIKVNIGQDIITDFAKITLDKVTQAKKILPSDRSSYYSYKNSSKGEHFFYLTGTLKNTSGETYSIENIDGTICFDNKYKYTAYIIVDDGGNDFTFTESVKPLKSVKYYLSAAVPDEIINKYKKVSINFEFKKNFKSNSYGLDNSSPDYSYELDAIK